MTSRTGLISLAVLAAGALGAAGCGSSNSNSNNDNTTKTTQAAAMTGTTVAVADNGKLGKILVDGKGDTLYQFEKDTGTTSMCSGACASNWPPLRASGKPTAGDAATAAKLGTTKRSDGAVQVTYNGHPLYQYTGDQKSGDANGQGLNAFGAEWYVMSPAGSKVEAGEGSDSKDSSDSSGGSGY